MAKPAGGPTPRGPKAQDEDDDDGAGMAWNFLIDETIHNVDQGQKFLVFFYFLNFF